MKTLDPSIVTLSLISDEPKRLIAEKFGVNNVKEFIDLVAKENNISIDDAKDRIVNNAEAMKIAFILA